MGDRPIGQGASAAVRQLEELVAVALDLPQLDVGEVPLRSEVVLGHLQVDLDVPEPLLVGLAVFHLPLEVVRDQDLQPSVRRRTLRPVLPLLLELLQPGGGEFLRLVRTSGGEVAPIRLEGFLPSADILEISKIGVRVGVGVAALAGVDPGFDSCVTERWDATSWCVVSDSAP